MSGSLLTVTDLTAGVGDKSTPAILDRVSLTLAGGERVALVGPSGAGKSSLIRLAMGLNRPVTRRSGTVTFCGKDVFALAPKELRDLRRRNLAFVPQNPASALDPLMPLQKQWRRNLETIEPTFDPAAANDVLRLVGLTSSLAVYPHTWSRGMQQRLLVAMALARRPRLLILDEPTSALDPILAADVMRCIVENARLQGTALLMITHHQGLAASACDRLLWLEKGRIIKLKGPEGARSAAQNTRAYHRPAAGTGDRSQSIVRADNIVVRRGSRVVLDGISFSMSKGEVLAVIGESGAGKTTLAQTVLGLLHPASGHCTIESRLPGVVFQDPLSALNPAFRIEYAIAEPLLARGASRTTALAQAKALARRFGLDDALMRRRVHDVSIGQAQRVCIARALIANPEFILLDEPLSALDRTIADEVITSLQGVREEFNPAMLIVTHDLDFARRIADQILVLRHGRMVEHRAVDSFFLHPRSEYCRELVAAARAVGDLVESEAA